MHLFTFKRTEVLKSNWCVGALPKTPPPTFYEDVKKDLFPITSLLNIATKCCGVCK